MANFRFFLLLLGLIQPFALAAQWPTPTPWLAPGQSYWKIHLAAEGWYGLSPELLAQHGLAGSVLDRLQLFYAGKEQPLWVAPRGGVWFWGQKNRGELDGALYDGGLASALNPDYSLYSDTAVYCLTVAPPGTAVARYQSAQGLDQPGRPVTWCWRTTTQVFHQAFSAPRYDAANLVSFSSYDAAEGFGSKFARYHRIPLHLDQPLATGPPATLQLRLGANHSYTHHLLWQTHAPAHPERASAQWQEIDTLLRYELGVYSRQIPAVALAANWEVQVQGQFDDRDQYTIASVKMRYPSSWPATLADTLCFALPPHPEQRTLLWPGASTPGTWLLLNQTQQLAYTWHLDNLTLPPATAEQQFLLVRLEAGQLVQTLTPGIFPTLAMDDANYLILAPTTWLVDPALRAPLDSFAAFRRSAEGGQFRVKILDSQSLYDAFAFGHSGHPLAFRQLARWLTERQQLPDYILLVGHGLEYTKPRVQPGRWNHLQLLPPFGSPGSDQLLLALPGRLVPVAPVGRLAVDHPQALAAYLNKLRQQTKALHVAGGNPSWRKRVLQVAGGSTPAEQADFQQRLRRLGELLRQGPFAAQLKQIAKADARTTSAAAAVVATIDSGVILKTFLGHGATTNTDFGLDDPHFFGTTAHYPLMFSLGCLTGNLFDQQISLSERFVLTPGRGASAYIASSSYAYPDVLEAFAGAWYRRLAQAASGGVGIGQIHQQALLELEPFAAQSFAYRSLLEQINLHGDPALLLSSSGQSQPVFAAGSTFIAPAQPTVATDSFDLSGVIEELGYAQGDRLLLRGEQRDPRGQLQVFEHYLPRQGWRSHWTLRRPTLGLAGEHRFKLYLLPESNGSAVPYDVLEYTITIAPGRLNLLYPPPQALLSLRQRPHLVVTTLSDEPIVFRIDTTPQLRTPLLYQMLAPTGGVAVCSLAGCLPPQGGTFFWTAQQGTHYSAVQSFTWEGSHDGWAQQHPFQWHQNSFEGLTLLDSGCWEFAPRWHNVIGESIELGSMQSAPTRILFNNHRIFRAPFWWGWGPSWCIAVFDPLTGLPWENPPGGRWGAGNPERQPIPAFVFRSTSQTERAKALHFLQEVVPRGHYVLLLNHTEEGQNTLADQWAADTTELGTSIEKFLVTQGATQVSAWIKGGGGPYALAYRQDQGRLGEQLVGHAGAPCLVRFELPAAGKKGSLQSNWIGPALRWLRWVNPLGAEPPSPSQAQLRLVASSPQHEQQWVVYAGAWPRDSIDLRGVAADRFPWLRLELELTDSSSYQPWCPGQWQVHHQSGGVGVAQLLPLPPDSLEQGIPLTTRVKLTNWGTGTLDSGFWRFQLRTLAGQAEEKQGQSPELAPLDTVSWAVNLNTRRLQGLAQWLARAQSQSGSSGEGGWSHTLAGALWLEPDRVSPLLELSIDGRPALQSQTIQTHPVFQFRLSDPIASWNARDTGLLIVRLEHETGNLYFPQFRGDASTQLLASPGQPLTLYWQPHLREPGWYTLEVQARDAAGNWVGPGQYLLDLYLSPEVPPTKLTPSPNPCDGDCHFVLELPDGELPTRWRVEIFSLTGQLLRELNAEELGPLRYGWQKSVGSWDGRDAAGQTVPNGLYWYRAWLELPGGPTGTTTWRRLTGKIVLRR